VHAYCYTRTAKGGQDGGRAERRSFTEKLKREKQVSCTARGHPRHYFARRGAARSARGVDEGSTRRERSGKRRLDASISRFAEDVSALTIGVSCRDCTSEKVSIRDAEEGGGRLLGIRHASRCGNSRELNRAIGSIDPSYGASGEWLKRDGCVRFGDPSRFLSCDVHVAKSRREVTQV